MATRGFSQPLELQRQLYRQGQLLRSVDLGDGLAADAQMRWWHNRAVHQAFGVVAGLTATVDDAGATVTVSPGLAGDGFGRELLLRKTVVVAIPEREGDWTLVAHYAREAQTPCSSSPCWPMPPAGQGMELELRWLPARLVRPGDVVPLLLLPHTSAVPLLEDPGDVSAYGLTYDASGQELRYHSGVITVDHLTFMVTQMIDPALRQAVERLYDVSRGVAGVMPRFRVRPFAQPRLGNGVLDPRGRWDLWIVRRDDREVPVGAQVTVDTSAAGFTTTPHYFVWPEWEQNAHDDFVALDLMHRGWTYVTAATPDRVMFQVLTVFALQPAAGMHPVFRAGESNRDARGRLEREVTARLESLKFTLAWLGVEIEPVAGT